MKDYIVRQAYDKGYDAGLRVIVCQGAGCARIIYLSSDVEPSQRVAKQRARDNGWRLDVSGGYCPRCK